MKEVKTPVFSAIKGYFLAIALLAAVMAAFFIAWSISIVFTWVIIPLVVLCWLFYMAYGAFTNKFDYEDTSAPGLEEFRWEQDRTQDP